jgi:hypothetical protein
MAIVAHSLSLIATKVRAWMTWNDFWLLCRKIPPQGEELATSSQNKKIRVSGDFSMAMVPPYFP